LDSLQIGHIRIFFIIFFYEDKEATISTTWSQNLGESCAQISDPISLYFLRYGLMNLGFLEAPELSHKQVT